MNSFTLSTDYLRGLSISLPVPDTDGETEAKSWKPVARPAEKVQAFPAIQSLPPSVPLVVRLSDSGVFVLGVL